MAYPTLDYFAFAHLPPKLQAISEPYCKLAETLAATPTSNPQEVAAGLRKLLEAKDCAVRAALSAPKAEGG